MHNVAKTVMVAVAIAACAALASPAVAADTLVGADVVSAYVWRGLTLNDGFVLQPSANIDHPVGIGFNVWGNFDLESWDADGDGVNEVKSGEMSEVDLTLYYAIPVEQVDLDIGLISYLFPAGAEGTREAYLSVGKDLGLLRWVSAAIPTEILEDFGWGIFVAYDFDEVDDYYSSLSLSYGWDVNEQWDIELSGKIGLVGSDYAKLVNGGTSSGWNEWQANLAGTYQITESTALALYIAYVDSVDKDVLPTQAVDFFGGASVYYSF